MDEYMTTERGEEEAVLVTILEMETHPYRRRVLQRHLDRLSSAEAVVGAAREALPLLSTFYRSYVPNIPEDRHLPTVIRRLRRSLEAYKEGQDGS